MDPLGVVDIEAPEVDQLARRIDLGLERRLALPEHRGGVEHGAPTRREQVCCLEEDGGAIGQAPARPIAPRVPGRFDRGSDLFRAGLMHLGEHVPVTMRHHGIDGLAGSDFLAANDDGDLDLAAAQVFERLLELGALA